MCTAAGYKTGGLYFGRTLDLEYSYLEEVTVTPRGFPFEFRHTQKLESHYAMIGMAYISDGYPLYYDGVNEAGLCIAGLNFVGNAHYCEPCDGKINIAQFEFIPYILSKFGAVGEVKEALKNICITNTPFSSALPCAQLHWIIADKDECIVVEATERGLEVFNNPTYVLTNNPPFNMQLHNLNNFLNLSSSEPKNSFSDKLQLKSYSRGMGALGLPGDLSSQSRFVRATFMAQNSLSESGETESVNQFFHILGSVNKPRGACRLENGKNDITVYTSCMSANLGAYYYTTYTNHRISAAYMHRENLDSDTLYRYPLNTSEQINEIN